MSSRRIYEPFVGVPDGRRFQIYHILLTRVTMDREVTWC